MSIPINKLINFSQTYLQVSQFTDYCHNGLQVEGETQVDKIITGVSLSQQLIEQAVQEEAQLILVHHGFFVGDIPSPCQLSGVNRDRLALLLQYNLNLAGFHLPLDANLTIGNNISLARLFNLENITRFLGVGVMGEKSEEIEFEDLVQEVGEKLDAQVYKIQANSHKVKKIAIISGGASEEFEQAKRQGADAYITGEIKEKTVRKIEEAKFNYISAGHYNTEKLGIYNLGELLAKKFNISHEFVDIPTEV